MKSFEQWEYEEIESTFGLTRIKNHPLLIDWLAVTAQVAPAEQSILEKLQSLLFDHADAWNEDELKFFFISPVISMVGFQQEKYNSFTQRKLSAKIGDIEISGVVDFMVATGMQHPRTPFFFLHEYKQERKRDNDPLGQLLIAMLAAQARNKQAFPIYGTYIIGRNWFFVLLNGQEYAVSDEFVATKADLFNIYAILMKTKDYIETNLTLLGK